MNEIERAIKVLEEEYAFTLECDATQKRSSAYKTALAALRAELSRQENAPLTWNERINQMTVEEKADVAVILSKRCARALKKESCPDLTCWQCFIEFFNSPYTEGAANSAAEVEK